MYIGRLLYIEKPHFLSDDISKNKSKLTTYNKSRKIVKRDVVLWKNTD